MDMDEDMSNDDSRFSDTNSLMVNFNYIINNTGDWGSFSTVQYVPEVSYRP